MTGSQHYAEAERLAAMAAEAIDSTKGIPREDGRDAMLSALAVAGLAQVHATLAVAAGADER